MDANFPGWKNDCIKSNQFGKYKKRGAIYPIFLGGRAVYDAESHGERCVVHSQGPSQVHFWGPGATAGAALSPGHPLGELREALGGGPLIMIQCHC